MSQGFTAKTTQHLFTGVLTAGPTLEPGGSASESLRLHLTPEPLHPKLEKSKGEKGRDPTESLMVPCQMPHVESPSPQGQAVGLWATSFCPTTTIRGPLMPWSPFSGPTSLAPRGTGLPQSTESFTTCDIACSTEA